MVRSGRRTALQTGFGGGIADAPVAVYTSRMSDSGLMESLLRRGVVIHAPTATVVEDLEPEAIEPGVEIFPGCTVRGKKTRLGGGTRLGRAGGGWFQDICTGRDVDLYGGFFRDAVFLDRVVVRGHAEMRGGTLMEEEAEAAHHVGYKMTITMPWVIAGSLVNFCDALLSGGTGRADHTEIGSAIALYNFTPRGDKFASLFGDVPRGVFLRSPRIFLGGQAQIVSPVKVGFGAVVAAGSSVRRSVPEGVLYGEASVAMERPYEAMRYEKANSLIRLTVSFVGQLRALEAWYTAVRLPGVAGPEHRDPHALAVYEAARNQIRVGIQERVRRLLSLVERLPTSVALHRRAQAETDGEVRARHRAMAMEQEALMVAWARIRAALEAPTSAESLGFLAPLGERFGRHNAALGRTDYLGFVTGALDDAEVASGQAALQSIVDAVMVASGMA